MKEQDKNCSRPLPTDSPTCVSDVCRLESFQAGRYKINGLREGVFYVEGAKKAALYDTQNGNVYSINREASLVLKQQNTDSAFWLKLKDIGLIVDECASQVEETKTPITIPEPVLQFAWLEVTGFCNERCLHCYGSFSPESNGKATKHLEHEDWKDIISSLTDNGCRQIQFIGGEPFVYRGKNKRTVLDLVEYARHQDFHFIEIFTNGTLISATDVRRLKDLGANIAISLYSSDEVTHDGITQLPGSFRKTMNAVHMLQEAGVPLRLSFVIMKQNESTIESTTEMIKSLGLNTGSPDVVRPNGHMRGIDVIPSQETILKYGVISASDFRTDSSSFWKNQLYHNCLAGKLAITADGEVIPCVFSRSQVAGNLKKIDLRTILDSQSLKDIWQLTKDKYLVCKDCEYRYACFDCRPLAEGLSCSKNYTKAPYPRCTYNPYDGVWGSGFWRMDSQDQVYYQELLPNY